MAETANNHNFTREDIQQDGKNDANLTTQTDVKESGPSQERDERLEHIITSALVYHASLLLIRSEYILNQS